MPVYEDMTTYNNMNTRKTYSAYPDDPSSEALNITVDLSFYPTVKLDQEYLITLAENRRDYYRSGVEHLPDAFSGESEEQDEKVQKMVERYQMRADALDELLNKLKDTDMGQDELLTTYSEICAADSMY